MSVVDSRSRETAYTSKPNIVVPNGAGGEPRSATEIRDRAALVAETASSSDRRSYSRAGAAVTVTHSTPPKSS